MRPSVLRSAFVSFPLLGVMAIACTPTDPDSAPQDDAGGIDGGTPFDGGTTTPDGGGPSDGSSGTDGSVVTSGAITVTAKHDDDTPEVGADVYFFEDTAAVFHTTTDASGSASHAVGHATSVTVFHHIYAGYPDREIVTVTSAAPGDHVTIGREGIIPVAYGDSLYADIPSNAGFTGATTYTEEAGDCPGGSTTQTMLPVHSSFSPSTYCYKEGDSLTVLMSAYATSDLGVPLAYATKTGTLTNPISTITFATGDWKATTTKSASISGTPPTWAQSVDITARFPDAKGINFAIQGNVVAYPGDVSTLAFSYAPPPTASVALNSQLYAQTQTGLTKAVSKLSHHAGPNDAVAFDWSHLLPKVSAPAASGTVTTPIVSWTPDSPLTVGSSGVVQLDAPGGDAGGTIHWRIVFPVDGNQITPPALPTDVAAYVPGGAWSAKSIVVSSGAVTYADLRQTPTATAEALIFAGGAATGEVATTSNGAQ